MSKDIARLMFLLLAWLFAGCAATEPPPLPQNNPADPQVRSSSKAPRNLLTPDETTVAIQKQLSATQEQAESAESMQHMDHGNMPGMQHGEMKMKDHQAKPSDVAPEKKVLADEMKKTSDEMKRTSDEMKQKSDEMKPGVNVYTCPMHPQIKSDKPGKCPICGMTLVKKKVGE